MKFKPKNRDELETVIKEIVTNQIKDRNYQYGLKDVDVSLITDMSDLFSCNKNYRRYEINRKINWKDPRNSIVDWNVSSVTDMSAMFVSSSFNQPIDSWNTSNVTDMSYIFTDSGFNQTLNSWDVRSVTNMYAMFADSLFNNNISNWNVSNVTDMQFIFQKTQFNKNLSKWIFTLNKDCYLNYFNKSSKHKEKYGVIDSYKDFIEKQLTNEFIEDIFKSNNDKDKYQLLKILKQYPDIVKNLDICREIV